MDKLTIIDYQNDKEAPKVGAFKVWWYVNDRWEHKGWLMPPITPENNNG